MEMTEGGAVRVQEYTGDVFFDICVPVDRWRRVLYILGFFK